METQNEASNEVAYKLLQNWTVLWIVECGKIAYIPVCNLITVISLERHDLSFMIDCLFISSVAA